VGFIIGAFMCSCLRDNSLDFDIDLPVTITYYMYSVSRMVVYVNKGSSLLHSVW